MSPSYWRRCELAIFPARDKCRRNCLPRVRPFASRRWRWNPHARYATPTELADDLERRLADEPVRAYREPFSNRVRRWGRRHRALVTGAAALLVTTAVALAMSTILIGRQQAETEKQRQIAVAAKKLADDNLQLAETNAQRAEKAQKLAEEQADESAARFQLALESYKQLVFGVQTRLENIPGIRTCDWSC